MPPKKPKTKKPKTKKPLPLIITTGKFKEEEAQYYHGMEEIDEMMSLDIEDIRREIKTEIQCPILENTLFREATFAYSSSHKNAVSPIVVTIITASKMENIVAPVDVKDFDNLRRLTKRRKSDGVIEICQGERTPLGVSAGFQSWLEKNVVPEQCAKLGVWDTEGKVTVRLEKVVLVDEGVDGGVQDQSTKESGLFARMLVTLPSEVQFEGGKLTVSMNNQSKTFYLQDEVGLVRATTWYTNENITVETNPIKSGGHISLVYSLIHNGGPGSVTPSTSTTMFSHDRLVNLLEGCAKENRHIALTLRHQYMPPLAISLLRSTDAASLQKVVEAVAASSVPWSVHIAVLNVKVARQVGDYCDELGGYYTSNDKYDIVASHFVKVYGEFDRFPALSINWDLKDILPAGCFDDFEGKALKFDEQTVRRFGGDLMETQNTYRRVAILLWPVRKTGEMMSLATLQRGGTQWHQLYAQEQERITTPQGKYAVIDMIRETACDGTIAKMASGRAIWTLSNLKTDGEREMVKESFLEWASKSEKDKLSDTKIETLLFMHPKRHYTAAEDYKPPLEGYDDMIVSCIAKLFELGVQDIGWVKKAVLLVGWEHVEKLVIAASVGIPNPFAWNDISNSVIREAEGKPEVENRVQCSYVAAMDRLVQAFTQRFYDRGINTNTLPSQYKMTEDNLAKLIEVIMIPGSGNVGSGTLLKLLFDGLPVRMRESESATLTGVFFNRRTVEYTATQRAIDEVYCPLLRATRLCLVNTLLSEYYDNFQRELAALIYKAYERTIPQKVKLVGVGKVDCISYLLHTTKEAPKREERQPQTRSSRSSAPAPSLPANPTTPLSNLPASANSSDEFVKPCAICPTINAFLRDEAVSHIRISSNSGNNNFPALRMHAEMMEQFTKDMAAKHAQLPVDFLEAKLVRIYPKANTVAGPSKSDGHLTITKTYQAKYEYALWEKEKWGKLRDDLLVSLGLPVLSRGKIAIMTAGDFARKTLKRSAEEAGGDKLDSRAAKRMKTIPGANQS